VAVLDRLAAWIRGRLEAGEAARLIFICTHNSRRSHMAELWARAGAARFGLDRVETFSGGTEATAFNPRAVAAMTRAGFRIEGDATAGNPRYRVRLADDQPPTEAFSKIFDQPPNPSSGFCAVMTCDAADAACPVVLGADERIAVTYVDPKESDGMEAEAGTYDERCRQIGREMLYAMSLAAGGDAT
jgi:arsenate reductase